MAILIGGYTRIVFLKLLTICKLNGISESHFKCVSHLYNKKLITMELNTQML